MSRQRLAYAQLHTTILTSDSVARLSDGGRLLYILGLAKAVADSTDGVLDLSEPRLVYRWCTFDGGVTAVHAAIADVVSQGMLVPVPGEQGLFRYPTWEEWQVPGRAGRAQGAVASSHKRWHEGRGIVNPNCPLCPVGENVEGDDAANHPAMEKVAQDQADHDLLDLEAPAGTVPSPRRRQATPRGRLTAADVAEQLDSALDDVTEGSHPMAGYRDGLAAADELAAANPDLSRDLDKYLRQRVVAHAFARSGLTVGDREWTRLNKAIDQLGAERIIGAALDVALADIKGSAVSYVIATVRTRLAEDGDA